MSLKFLSAPQHRADVSASYGAPARRVVIAEVPITAEQTAAIESYGAPAAPTAPTQRSFQRVGHVVCCAPTRPDMPARNGRGTL